MPKLKTHKGTKKRIRVTKNGRILRRKAGTRHNLQKKSPTRKRRLGHFGEIIGSYKKTLFKRLGL